ncbi:hypothetical protein RIF29_16231 [Crotalaria pallida]|uniref:Reverse transcriptase zinc-binding domain-containing protein n=1 Tax=Crotalaria pallida TaxID=3830 RepID=A0AAN9IE96_CROPI
MLKNEVKDSWWWSVEAVGSYSVKSAYNLIQDQHRAGERIAEHSEILWKPDAPLKAIAFRWRVIMDKIPINLNLMRRGILMSADRAKCQRCLLQDEDSGHLLCSVRIGALQLELILFPY